MFSQKQSLAPFFFILMHMYGIVLKIINKYKEKLRSLSSIRVIEKKVVKQRKSSIPEDKLVDIHS